VHELSIAENILEIIEERRSELGFRSLGSVSLKIGLLSAVDEEALRFAFETLVEGGPYEGADIEIETTWPRARCACGCEFEVRDILYVCPDCGAVTAELSGGDDLDIIGLEVE
jgi:hydrogenase nickel incorporation protein HypA/HybF